MMSVRKSLAALALGVASVAAPFVAATPAHAGTNVSGSVRLLNTPPQLSPGVRNTAVLTLKHDLGFLMNDSALKSATDTAYDPATVLKVKSIQSFTGIAADGIVGPATWNMIFVGMDNYLTAQAAFPIAGDGPMLLAMSADATAKYFTVLCSVGTKVVGFAIDETQPLPELGNMAPCTYGTAKLALPISSKRILGTHTFHIYASTYDAAGVELTRTHNTFLSVLF